MRKKVTVVLPCRKGSKRVKGKNTRSFYKYKFGLFELKLDQLLKTKLIDSIVVSTDDDNIISFINNRGGSLNKEVISQKRPDHLAVDDCLDDLIVYLSDSVDTDTLIWTHVTSPFFTEKDYDHAIHEYNNNLSNNLFDSLVSVNSVHTFAIQAGRWISHNIKEKKWPRKQDVEKIMLINGAIYIIERDLMRAKADRIGDSPFYYELKGLSGFDIDYEEDFSIAEKIAPCILNG